MNGYKQLQKELLTAGASEAEIKDLLPIASSLRLLKTNKTVLAKDQVKPSHWLRIIKPVAYVTAGLASGMFIIIISQAALPSSILYSVQKLSDSIAIDIHPPYRANVMMKRAQQVNELVAQHADSKVVLAALADYSKQATIYRSIPRANYAAFEYCKTNLEQAAAAAPPNVRQAISRSLNTLENT